MSKKKELFVPVVATRGVIVFPNQDVMIEVGRKKSINAIEDAMENYDGHAWIVCQNDIMVDDPKEDDLFTFGTLSKIKSIRRKEGFMRVVFTGLERAQLVKLEDSKEQINATIELVSNIKGDDKHELVLIKKVISEFEKMGTINTNFPPEVITQLTKGVSADTLADQFAQYYPFSIDSKQNLLETLDVNERLLLILDELAKERQMSQIEHSINNKVKERIEGGQREYYLREKLRAIKEELGDVSNITDDTSDLRETIENNPYPEHVKLKALEELQRYEMLPQASGEASVVRSYLDWLLKTPWWQETEDNDDLNMAQQILDEDHYGLEKVKERIMEYLAVKQMTNSLKAPILCLVGPPGVGKTSLAKSIARAIDRKFVKISLGGVRDEAEIRGHRRTYLGSMPGRIIQGMKRAGVINPVFLIDEIDKLGADYKGDPSSAMLEVLDPEQNTQFSDHYLEEPYDLSKVLFIATANYLENIPAALRDRLEIINLSSYTELEKVEIAKDHLIPKQVLANGLKKSQFKLEENELIYLIRHYTREAGVRQLERVIATLCRKTVLAILKDGKKSVKISKKLIVSWLGKEMYEYGNKEKGDQVGVVTGLAYTSFGGDVLPVEVTYFEGKGKLNVTGQLGKVMTESTEIALDYIKSNAKKLKIDPKFFDSNDIHIHVPEGAVPKDGPSAGVTITTALVSAITNTPVKADLAMTGEVTLRGHVLAIGGLREKSLAAHRVGITNIVIPKTNLKDVDELPDAVKESIKFIPVDNVDQVLKEALVK
ncbi:MAG TPA: endopeptidase La [Erysipelotrichaceae bacterium]|jgi:ATP-dependent Lon protease|nr:endopeptidase La [Bacillota bacterium]NLP22632.1 endopeptidase La [Erysipelotrichaceae bacterium]HCY06965.1 endopeptidase La [Erysipelotrichaceae bacterium]